jgi:hypothetical protein
MASVKTDLKEKTLAMTGFFETSTGYPTCYGVTSGNHDYQGLSHGVLQFNFGTGSLQPLWNYLNTNYNQMCRDIFGAYYAEWANVLAMPTVDQVAWGDSISLGTTQEEKRQIDPTWKALFQTLGETQASIDKQIPYSENWRPNADRFFNTLGLWSRRGYALCWDISVQMGRLMPLNLIWQDFLKIDPTGKTLEQIEEEKLYIIVERATYFNRDMSDLNKGIVHNRKQMIVDGTGSYYGAAFSMPQYDLNYEPAFERNLQRGLFFEEPKPAKPVVEVTNLYNGVRLDWKPTANTKSYKVYRAENIENLGITLTEITDSQNTSFTDTTAVGGTTYYYTVKALFDFNSTNSEKATGIPSSIQIYENHMVDFTGYAAWTVYGDAQVNADFGNYSTLQGGDRLKIDTSERLRFELPVGMLGSANTGGIIKAGIVAKNEYTFDYEIRFDDLFPWSKGGKIPGISGGAGYTGGTPAWAGDGFSVRIMWREDGRLIPYVYHFNQPESFGDTFGATIGYLTYTKPYVIKYYVKLNTGANADGILRIYIDDVLSFEKTDIVYRTDNSKIDTAHLAIFAGGSTVDWNMTGTGYIRLSYVRWV